MKNLICCIFLLLQFSGNAQNNCKLFLDKEREISKLENRFEIYRFYDSIAHIGKPTIVSYLNALDIAIKNGDTPLVEKYFYLSVQNQDFSNRRNINYLYPKIYQYIDTAYLNRNYDSISNTLSKHFDYGICKKIDKFIFRDQYIRDLYNVYSVDSMSGVFMQKMLEGTDEENENLLREVCTKLGRFPGIKEIGSNRISMLRIILVHIITEMDSSFYYPLIRKSILEDNISPNFLPNIIDRNNFRENKPDMYGMNQEERDGLTYFREIQDIEHVDERRQYFCLPTLYEMKLEDPTIQLPTGYVKK